MNAHRSALDHVLTVIAESAWAECLVLRGSMTMPAWLGVAARTPGDLDWVLRMPEAVPLDDLDPYPYVDRLARVQQWPEAAHGAARNEIWEFEQFDTGGCHPRLPPEGLTWIPGAELKRLDDWYWDDEFSKLIEQNPRTPGGLEFDPDKIASSADWDYADYDQGSESARIRLGLPWQSPDGEQGEVRVDLSLGEHLPDPPVCTAVPRSDDLPPLGLWTATRQLSLAWKLHWLAADQQTHGVSAMNDLYDAVLLAELDGMHLRPRLRRLVLDAGFSAQRVEQSSAYPPQAPPSASSPAGSRPLERLLDPAEVRRWTISGTPTAGDDRGPWLTRLADAVTRLL